MIFLAVAQTWHSSVPQVGGRNNVRVSLFLTALNWKYQVVQFCRKRSAHDTCFHFCQKLKMQRLKQCIRIKPVCFGVCI